MSFERIGSQHGVGGPDRDRARRHASATTTATRPNARSSAPRLGRGRRPRRRAALPGAPAARGGGRGGAARAAGRQARRGGRGAARDREARARRGDRQGRAQLGAPEELLHLARVRRRGVHLFLATDLYDERAEADENERIEIVEAPLSELDRRDPRVPRLEDARRTALVRTYLPDAHVAAPRDGAGWRTNPCSDGHRRAAPRRAALRAPGARFPRLPRVRARAVAQHARGLPLDLLQFGRFLGARGVSALDAGPGDVADFLDGLARGDDERPPASPPRSTASPPACARSTATSAGRACASRTRPRP